jgi:transposase InsO family protein
MEHVWHYGAAGATSQREQTSKLTCVVRLVHYFREELYRISTKTPGDFYTDRGVLYGTASYQAILSHHGMIQSQSRKGDCYDNAVVESFFANLKNELTWHQRFNTRDEAKRAIFDYIEVFYNRQRLHETLDYMTPVRYEERAVA